MYFLIFLISFLILISITITLAYFFVIPFFFGAPYEPSRGKALKSIIKFTNPKSGDKIAELGSGDGRICIALAKNLQKIEIHGFEINPFLVSTKTLWQIKARGSIPPIVEKNILPLLSMFLTINPISSICAASIILGPLPFLLQIKFPILSVLISST